MKMKFKETTSGLEVSHEGKTYSYTLGKNLTIASGVAVTLPPFPIDALDPSNPVFSPLDSPIRIEGGSTWPPLVALCLQWTSRSMGSYEGPLQILDEEQAAEWIAEHLADHGHELISA